MAMKILTCLLFLAVTTQGASPIPLDLADNLQEFLINPEAMGVRMKRDVSDEWDKEFDLDMLGLHFKLKYNDPLHPIKGGHAHVKFPGKRFFNRLTFDDVDLDIIFNFGDYVDGVFDMKVDYKFVQKFVVMADRNQEGSFVIYRKLEGDLYKTKISVENKNKQHNPFFEVTIDSSEYTISNVDRNTKLYATFKYDHDNHWDMKIDRVPSKSITGVFTINGVEHTLVATLDEAASKINVKFLGCEKSYDLDFKFDRSAKELSVTGEFDGDVNIIMTYKKDLSSIILNAKYKNKNYAYIQLTGTADIKGLNRLMNGHEFDYSMKYNIMDSMMDGKVKIKYDASTPKKIIYISFVPKGETDLTLTYDLEFTDNNGWKANYEATRGGDSYFKWTQVYDVKTNNRNKFEMNTNDEIKMIPESQLYGLFCSYAGKCFTTGVRERKIIYHKKEKNVLLGKLLFEDTATLDSEKFAHVKVNTRKTPYTLIWYRPTGPAWLYNTHSLFGNDQVVVKVWHTVGKELKVETNVEEIKMTVRRDPDYFLEFIMNGETMLKFHTDHTLATLIYKIDTLFYLPSSHLIHSIFCAYGKGCFNKREGHMKVVFDRVNKNAILNKFSVESHIIKDNEKVLDFVVSTMVTPFTFNLNAPYILPQLFNNPTRKMIDATITHVMGKMLEIKSNCPEMETFKITSAGEKRTVTLNGKELVVFDYKSGEKKIHQVLELPSGENLEATVEWENDILRSNKVLVKVEVNPKRKFEGSFEWEFTANGKLDIKVTGVNPWLGDYEVTREGSWEINPNMYIFNWQGKTNFPKGPLAPFSPIDTLFKANVDMKKMNLDAHMLKTIGGKQWGFKVTKNNISILGGRS